MPRHVVTGWLVFCSVLDIFVNWDRIKCPYLHRRAVDHIIKLSVEKLIEEEAVCGCDRDRGD